MQRKLLIALTTVFLLTAKACAACAQGPILEHKPPVQVYQGVPFRLVVRPLVPLRRVVLQIDLAGVELKVPMRLANKVFHLNIPGKSTKGRRGPVSYSFIAVDAAGRLSEVNDPSGKRFQTRLLPPPAAALVYPVGGKATGDAFAVTIGLNEAFAVVPADSFRITFDGQGVLGTIVTPEQISFPVGPGLRDGPHTVKIETATVPGWKAYKRSWTFSLRKAPEEPVDKRSPLTVNVQTSGDAAALGEPQAGQTGNLNLSWDGKFLGLDGGFITPTLSPLALADPTSLTFTDSSLFGVQARLDLGPLGGRFILGQSVAGDADTYPQATIAAGVVLGSFSLNLAAVYGTSPDVIAQQSYVASLGYTAGSDEPGQRGGSVEIASALSFPDAQGTADWTNIQAQASSPDAPQSLKLLAALQPLLRPFPIPSTTALNPPDLGRGYRLTLWSPVGRATGRLELSQLERDFLSLGSNAYPGTTAVLMIAFDPERPATKPFTYDPGPVYESPEDAAGTYGLHLTGIGFDLFDDPARTGLDFFHTNWQSGDTAQTFRLLFGYYTYLDLDLALEICNNSLEGDPLEGHLYGIEGTGTKRIGLVTLSASAGVHMLSEYRPDPAYGFGLKFKYDGDLGDLGLVVVLDLTYGDPFDFQPGARELAWSLGTSVNF